MTIGSCRAKSRRYGDYISRNFSWLEDYSKAERLQDFVVEVAATTPPGREPGRPTEDGSLS